MYCFGYNLRVSLLHAAGVTASKAHIPAPPAGRQSQHGHMVTKSARRTLRVSLFRELAAAESPIRTAFDPVLERAAIGASDDYRREQGVNHRLSYASAGPGPVDWIF